MYASVTVATHEPIKRALYKSKANARYYFPRDGFLRCKDCDSLPEPAI
jgi:hypothetical protein